MAHKFQDQVVVVTGGSTGIGLASAKAFLAQGAKRVYITGRNSKSLEVARAELEKRAITVVSDVAKLEDLQALKSKIEGYGDTLDVIFANAGIAEKNSFGKTEETEFDKMFDINVKGVFFTIQTLLPLVKNEGAIVINASVAANTGMVDMSLYNASKAAVRSFARSFANELKDRKIRVNAVSPGFTNTPILKMNQEQIAELQAYVATVVPLGYMAQPSEIAEAVLFLASKGASYINGIELTVDGGFTQV